MAFFMLSTSKMVLISSWTGLASLDLVPAVAVSLFTASSSCNVNMNTTFRYRTHIGGNLPSRIVCVCVCVLCCVYLSIVNLQGVEFIRIFGEA